MSKIKVEDLKCYPSVGLVLGSSLAKNELFKVVNSRIDFDDEIDLSECFYWEDSPQGHRFWSEVYHEITDK